MTGHLLDPVYLIDREMLPAGSIVKGEVSQTKAVPVKDRVWDLLQADFTPTKKPVIAFTSVTTPSGKTYDMEAKAMERTASLIHMRSSAKKGHLAIFSLLRSQANDRVQRAKDTYLAPGKQDRFEQWVFRQMPYHPQRIWRATQFDAELQQPLLLDRTSSAACAEVPAEQLPASTLHARLMQDISSKNAHPGDEVTATLAQPVYEEHSSKLLLPQGAHMVGTVIRARPARMFGRSGVLRFNLKQVSVPPEESCEAQRRAHELALNGQVSGIEAQAGENVKLDSEGQAQAGASPNQVLAPLALAVLLARTYSDDGANAGTGAVSGGGIGLLGRVVSAATQSANVTQGFAYFALTKSVIRRFVLRGHEVEFPRNTRFDIDVAPREGVDHPMTRGK